MSPSMPLLEPGDPPPCEVKDRGGRSGIDGEYEVVEMYGGLGGRGSRPRSWWAWYSVIRGVRCSDPLLQKA